MAEYIAVSIDNSWAFISFFSMNEDAMQMNLLALKRTQMVTKHKLVFDPHLYLGLSKLPPRHYSIEESDPHRSSWIWTREAEKYCFSKLFGLKVSSF